MSNIDDALFALADSLRRGAARDLESAFVDVGCGAAERAYVRRKLKTTRSHGATDELRAALGATAPAKATGHALPFTVEGYAHPASTLASGVKDADGLWVAKCHPLNGDADDVKRSEKMAHLFKASPLLLSALVDLLDDSERVDAGMPRPIEERFAIKDAAKAAIKEASR